MSSDNDWFFEINNPVGPFIPQETIDRLTPISWRDIVHFYEGMRPLAIGEAVYLSVLELRPGDLIRSLSGSYIFVCRGSHPIWPHLQAVVWCDPEGKLSIDALGPRQQLPSPVVNRDETPEQRAQRFRDWYLERKV